MQDKKSHILFNETTPWRGRDIFHERAASWSITGIAISTFFCARENGKKGEEKRKEVGRWAVRCRKFAYFILKRRLKRILISKTSNMITAIAIYFK